MQVVIVDDDPGTLFITSAVIRRIDDAEPVGIGNPLVALEWLAGNTPDLILLDHDTPALDTAKAYIAERSGTHFDPACIDAFLRAWNAVIAIHHAYPEPDIAGPDIAALR